MPDASEPPAGASDPPAGKPLRRDAERNSRRILDAAREVFAARGLGATMDDVADHAGVGVGTVYRRFANKEELIDALFEDRIAAMAQLGRQGLDHDDPWEGLVFFFEQTLLAQAEDRGLKELLFDTAHGQHRVAHARDQMAPVVAALIDRARAAGQLRPGVQDHDTPVLLMMLGAVLDFSRDIEPELWRRYLAIVLDGLRARRDDGEELPGAALDEAQLDAAMAAWKAPPRR